jgi:hypothetical protein
VGIKAHWYGIHPAEMLEEQGLALHDGHRRLRADVAEPEHAAAVRDHGNGIALA